MSADRDEQLLDVIRLNRIPGIGPRLVRELLARFGSSSAVLTADHDALRSVPGIGPKLARSIVENREPSAARRELQRCRDAGVQLVLENEENYPRPLREIPDPPLLLYCRGRLEPQDELAVAVVGSRQGTHYGRRQAERLAGALARAGMTVVSGLARGIDAAAHRGALQAGGRTVGVLATGVTEIYPPEHRDLAEEIVQNGALLSESPLDQQPVPGLFPQRNRIISGVSLGVVIVEASEKSGALHTARHAMEQGREVFAVPGPIDTPHSEGCHRLIRDGATLVRHADDILDALGPLAEPVRRAESDEVRTPQELSLNDREREVLNLVSSEPRHVDEILRSCDIEASRVLSTLTVLEMKRLVRRLPGGNLVRAHG